jgi:hypothetical protein
MFEYLDEEKQKFPNIDKRTKKQMKDIEMVAQLLLFLEEGAKSYNQDYLDRAFSDRDSDWELKEEIEDEFRHTIRLIKKILKLSKDINLTKTRLKNQADFYSFFGAVAELSRQGELTIDEKLVMRIYKFIEMVDNEEERGNNKNAQNYYKAFKSSPTDSSSRQTRIDIMKSVLKGNV